MTEPETESGQNDVYAALTRIEAEVELLKEHSDVDVRRLEDAVCRVRDQVRDEDVQHAKQQLQEA